MEKCLIDDCNENQKNQYQYCEKHHEMIKNKLIDKRLNDPLYIDDMTLFLECEKVLIPLHEDEGPNDKYWMNCNMHHLLFEEYYDQNLSRTHLLIEKVKELHKKCCSTPLSEGTYYAKFYINEYKMYQRFLVKWIEDSQIIEKNKLVKDLDMVNDVTNIVQRIIVNL